MADDKVAKLYETQVSLTEWIQRINHDEAVALGEEDNYKRDRIGQVNAIIGLPYDKPTQFEATDIVNQTPDFKKFLKEHGDELCALRLIPKAGNPGLPKLRMRGKSIRDVAATWFLEQSIDPKRYVADFVPHSEASSWATIFVVNDKGIFGEIYFGGHHVLTQGMHTDKAPHVFNFDFSTWQIDPTNDEALAYLKEMVEMLKVGNETKRTELGKAVNATFANNYLKGYFETTHSKDSGTWFIDYNRILGDQYSDFDIGQVSSDGNASVTGRKASGGRAEGKVVIANSDTLLDEFPSGGILVCEMTSPDYLPLMQKAAAIITDKGGVLCHAAIVARELGKPCIVGTGNATKVLKSDQTVLVNADTGTVTLI